MIKLKAFIPIALSLLVALGGSYFVYKWKTAGKEPSNKEVKVKQTNQIKIVVAKKDIPHGNKINSELLQTAVFLKKSLPSGYFTEPDKLKNRIVVSSLKKGDPVVEHRLAPIDIKTGGISVVLDPGKRAIAVKGNDVLGISGFIKPGNRVDVLVTIKNPEKKINITKMVLEDILVLASGTQIQDNGEGKPSPVNVYTLEVTPEQGERLTLAATKGRLQFALRNINDGDSIATKGITIPQLLTSMAFADDKPEKKVLPKKGHIKRKVRKRNYKKPKKDEKASMIIIKGLEITDTKNIKL